MRLISVDALIRLMKIKEEVEDPGTRARIHHVLLPRDFIRLDGVVDLLFSTAEEVTRDDTAPPGERMDSEPALATISKKKTSKFTPVAFHEACAARISQHLGSTLIKRSRAMFSSPDERVAVLCAVSRAHGPPRRSSYWFAFHPHQKQIIEGAQTAYVGFGCGSPDAILLLPVGDFVPLLGNLNVTNLEDRFYWHIAISRDGQTYSLHQKKGLPKIALTKYFLRP
ncbi:MAG: hypothetical protein M3T49_04095 [Candidatus Eremiobacteraeota bacterium]|nr:hypothetical protein [Candidatus Eremiobacteraeota bacterium]